MFRFEATKMLALVLAAVMCMSMMSMVAFAANDGKITIDNAINGENYNLYKVFDLTYGGDGETNATGPTATEATAGTYNPVSYTYTADTSDEFLTALYGSTQFDVNLVPGTTDKYSVVRKNDATDAGIISFIQTNISKLPSSKKIGTEMTAANNKVEWTALDYGYYYVTSSAGSFVTIDSTIKEVTVKEKNTIPSLDKKQAIGTTAPTTADGYADTEQQVQIGDHVWYQIEVTDGKGTEKAITVTDTMDNGLTHDKNVKVYLLKSGETTEQEVTPTDATYTISNETVTGFVATFPFNYVKTLGEGDKLYIRFSATVNINAVTDTDVAKEINKSTLAYSNSTSEDSVDVVTYKFQLDKAKSDYSDLLGAKFKLYRTSVADGSLVKFSQGTTENDVPVLYVDATGTIDTIDLTAATGLNSAKVIIKGLDKDTYVLREIQAPDGYNAAADTTVADTTLVEINETISDVATAIVGDQHVVTVVNLTGTELPSTGGIGTTIFYIIGTILVIGAGIILVTRKRMGNAK